ncbi:MAG: hypothetical protein AB1489_41720, partial [Acidobacteriota bacterium]
MSLIKRLCTFIVVFTVLMGVISFANAGVGHSAMRKARPLQYAVKFVYGKSYGKELAPGTYFTEITIHNPSDHTVSLKKKTALALLGERAGPVSQFTDIVLGPDEVVTLNQVDINAANITDEIVRGFIIIESDTELDIVALYTVAGGDGEVKTLNTERILPGGRRTEKRESTNIIIPPPKPNLFAVADSFGSFCRLDDDGRLLVRVRNGGLVNAGGFFVQVSFETGDNTLRWVPSLTAGTNVDLAPINIP